jgi:hypothetical protein
MENLKVKFQTFLKTFKTQLFDTLCEKEHYFTKTQDPLPTLVVSMYVCL